ncbi:MAG: hypothetical protein IT537_21170 [Hyphomicrobiales bacterium]|nr:hypothetical protein [Hyphomicrobiales bacterium]
MRLGTGLVLLAYATTQLIDQVFGIRSVEAMQTASALLPRPGGRYTRTIAIADTVVEAVTLERPEDLERVLASPRR